MKIDSLASSSAGNVYVVSDRDTTLLLECGVTYKKLLKLTGFEISRFAACLVSHSHG